MYTQIASNKRKTIFLMVGFVLFCVALGQVMSLATGNRAMIIGMSVFSVGYALISYFASARIALSISGAKEVQKNDAPELYRIVENLSIAGGLPMPKVYIMNDPALNAFATGRDPQHAVVAVTTGLIEALDKQELEGVIAHELSHIGNYDIRLMAVVLVLVTIVSSMSNMFLHLTSWGEDDDGGSNPIFFVLAIVLALLTPVIATIMQLAVSRRREYLADASGAMLTRYPEGLAGALAKIAQSERPLKTANTATAHLFLSNPFKKGVGKGIAGLFSTHPPIEDRIAKLSKMDIAP